MIPKKIIISNAKRIVLSRVYNVGLRETALIKVVANQINYKVTTNIYTKEIDMVEFKNRIVKGRWRK